MTKVADRPPLKRVQPAMAFAARHLGDDLSLTRLSAQTGLSPFHLHRLFAQVTGETPKQFALRLRLGRGASMLLTSRDSVLSIALACGFGSHESFTRAFGRQFGMTPTHYRARGFAARTGTAAAAIHARLVGHIGPCVGLFHVRQDGSAPPRHDMTYSIVKKDLAPQPVLVVRRRVKRSEIGATIGGVLPDIFQYAQQHGIAIAGHPFTRYVEVGAGLLTIEPGMRIVGPRQAAASAGDGPGKGAASQAGVIEDTLPGGPAATTVHNGSYETLTEAYAALESWIESQGLQRAGAPWESYVTDPAEHPDPKDWKTEVCWPVRENR